MTIRNVTFTHLDYREYILSTYIRQEYTLRKYLRQEYIP